CKSLYDFPTVDCSVRFPARGRISDRVGAWADRHLRVGASPSMPALSERWIGFLASKWKERGDCCWPAKKHAAKPRLRALTRACLGAVEGNKHFVILRSAADLDGEGNLPHHREIAGRVALRHGGGDAHLVGRKRLLI